MTQSQNLQQLSIRSAFIKLHIAIFLAGFTGILGKMIHLAEGPLVWFRMVMTVLFFGIYLLVTRPFPRVSCRAMLRMFAVGSLVALHWVFFYGSVKYANVSIAVVCFTATGFFTALAEPLYYKKLPSTRELAYSLLVVCGILLIFHFDSRYRIGIILGLICAAFAALFTIGTKELGREHSSTTILFYEMLGGGLFLTALAPFYMHFFPHAVYVPNGYDLFYLFILSSVCTIGMFLLEIQALRKISAFTANLSFNLEPIYSIVIAMLFLNEANEVSISFFAGLALICCSVALQSIDAIKQQK